MPIGYPTRFKLTVDQESAINSSHTQNTDTKLDEGGANEITAAELTTLKGTTVPAKADKVTSATAGNLAELDASGNLVDSGITTIKPDVNPTLDLDFANQTYRSYVDHSGIVDWTLDGADSKFTFTRASTATYFDAMGIMQTALADELRIDYDPETGECLGLLVEESRTNLLTYSEDFSNAAWVKTRTSVGGTAVVVPDGSSVVCKLIDSIDDASHYMYQQTSKSADEAHTISFYAKAAEISSVDVWIADETFTDYSGYTFDLSAVTATNYVNTGVSSNVGSSIAAIGGGWYKCVCTAVVDASILGRVLIGLNNGSRTYAGDDTSGLYIWGAQLEAGAFPTSYIPTTTAAVTRNADVVSMTGVNFSDWYNQSEGVVFSNCVIGRQNSVGGTRVMRISDNTVNNYYDIFYRADGATGCGIATAGVVQVDTSPTGVLAPDATFKCVFGYKADDFAVSSNGAAVLTDATIIPATLDRIHMGSNMGGGLFLNGHIKQLQYYPRRLTNIQLQALSA